MTYLENLKKEDREVLTIVDVSVREYYIQIKSELSKDNPDFDFSLGEIKIKNLLFTKDCHFVGNFDCTIEFKNCHFLNETVFYNSTFLKRIAFNHCFFERDLRVMNSTKFISEFDLIMISIKTQLYVDGGTFADCKWTIIDNGIVKISGGDYQSLNIGYWGGGSILNELNFHLPKVSGSIKVTGSKSKIQRLQIFQFSSDNSIAIEDISVNCLSIYRYRNEKSLRLLNIKSLKSSQPSEFSISESYLGKAEWYSIDLNSFDNIYIQDVHLVDCSFVNIDWNFDIKAFKGSGISKTDIEERLPQKIQKIEKDEADDFSEIEQLKRDPDVLSYYSKSREVFRQLKYSLGKQGDIINEQKYHAKEMLAYDKSILIENDFWTKAIIKLSHLVSDFGQSFSRPFWSLIIGHWILFIILILSGNFSNLSISITQGNNEGFKFAFEQYFRLINPLRRAEITFDGYTIIIDVLMRIWSSYMIYNIIRATRRFIK